MSQIKVDLCCFLMIMGVNKGEQPYVCKRNGTQIHWTALCWL